MLVNHLLARLARLRPFRVGADTVCRHFVSTVKLKGPRTGRASPHAHLFVDISPAFEKRSKSKRRKASRYGKPLPKESQETVGTLVQKTVADWWNR